MERERIKLNKLHIPGLQNYYEFEAGILPNEEDIQETIKKLTADIQDKEKRE